MWSMETLVGAEYLLRTSSEVLRVFNLIKILMFMPAQFAGIVTKSTSNPPCKFLSCQKHSNHIPFLIYAD